MDFYSSPQRPEPPIIYATKKGAVSWAQDAKVWVIVEKQPDSKYLVKAQIEQPHEKSNNWLNFLPTTQTNIESEDTAKIMANQWFVDREKWPKQ
jgi:hypothetical protein